MCSLLAFIFCLPFSSRGLGFLPSWRTRHNYGNFKLQSDGCLTIRRHQYGAWIPVKITLYASSFISFCSLLISTKFPELGSFLAYFLLHADCGKRRFSGSLSSYLRQLRRKENRKIYRGKIIARNWTLRKLNGSKIERAKLKASNFLFYDCYKAYF
jgi:hypothetical protein